MSWELVLKVHAFSQSPAAEMPETAVLADGLAKVVHNPVKKLKQVLFTVKAIGRVDVEIGLFEQRTVLSLVAVHFHNLFDKRPVVRVIVAAEHAFGIELLADAGVTPINGHAASPHGVHKLLGGVAGDFFVFVAEVELAGLVKGELGTAAHRQRAANGVHKAAAGFEGFTRVEHFEKLHPLRGAALVGVGDNSGTELGFSRDDGDGLAGLFNQFNGGGFATPDIVREAQVAWVVEVVAGERVVRALPVGQDRFTRPKQFFTGVEPVQVAAFLEDKKVGFIANNNREVPAQDLGKPVVDLVDAAEVGEIEFDDRFNLGGGGHGKVAKGAWRCHDWA